MTQRDLIVLLLFGFGKKFTTESTEDTEIRGRTTKTPLEFVLPDGTALRVRSE
jgi:hypothetical protein